MDPALGYVLAAGAAVIWGVILIPVKAARAPGHLGIAISMPAGVVGLLVATLVAAPDSLDPAVIFSPAGLLLALAGICQFPLGTACYYGAVRCGEVSAVTPLTRLKSVLVLLVAALAGIEIVTGGVALGCALGLAGGVLITRGPRRGRTSAGRENAKGMAFALAAAAAWAAGDILIRLALKHVPPLPATLVALAMGAAAYYLVLLARGKLSLVAAMSRRDKLLYATHGVFSFGAGYLMNFAAIAAIGVTRTVVITGAWPAVSFVLGLTLYRERATPVKLAGFALLMAGATLVMAK